MRVIRPFLRLSIASQILLIFCLSVLLRVGFVLLMRVYATPVNLMELQKIAKSLAETGSFANPYSLPTGPTAHCAPLYVFLVALVYKLLGTGIAGQCGSMALGILIVSTANALMPIAAKACKMPAAPGFLAGLIAAVPFRPYVELDGWENTLASLLILIGVIVTVRWLEDSGSGAITGLVWGLLLLTVSSAVLVFAGILLVSLFARWVTFRQAAVAALVASAVLLPWIVRNYFQLGAFVFVRSNFGLELALSNRDGVYPTLVENIFVHPEYALAHHPYTSPTEAARVAQMGEAAYNRLRLGEARSWIEKHPREFLKLLGRRIVGFWFMRSYPVYKDFLFFFPATILAFVGVIHFSRINRRAAGVLALFLFLYPSIYYLVQLSSRYRYPLEGIILLLACWEVTALAARGPGRTARDLGRRLAEE